MTTPSPARHQRRPSGDGSSAATAGRLEVSVVVPVYGCAACLPELVERLAGSLETFLESGDTWEVVLVDDASPDGAARVGLRLAAAHPQLRLLRLDRNRGQQRAVLAGLVHARGTWAVVLDCDLQDPPEAVPLLVAHGRESGADAVFAGRRGRYQGMGRMLTSAVFRLARGWICGVPRDAGLFVALHRPLVRELVAGCGPRPRVVPMIGLSGRSIASIPVPRRRRPKGGSSYTAAGRLRSATAELAWALRHRIGGSHGGPVDPASWIAEVLPTSDAGPPAASPVPSEPK